MTFFSFRGVIFTEPPPPPRHNSHGSRPNRVIVGPFESRPFVSRRNCFSKWSGLVITEYSGRHLKVKYLRGGGRQGKGERGRERARKGERRREGPRSLGRSQDISYHPDILRRETADFIRLTRAIMRREASCQIGYGWLN